MKDSYLRAKKSTN